MSELFLGLDVGTTRTKALLCDAAGRLAAPVASTPTPQVDVDGVPSHSPAAVLDAAAGVAARVLADAERAGGGRLAALCVTSVGEEAVLLDGDGAPVGAVPTWFSGVGAPFAERDAALLDQRAPLTGVRHPEHTVHVLAWWAAHRPERTRAAVGLTDLGSWLLSALGADRLVMDHSHASRTGLFDAPSRRWRPEALEVVGAPHLRLPDLVPSGTVVGALSPDAARRLGAAPGTPLVAGGHDHFCGALGAGARHAGDLFVSAGTSEAHVLLTDALDPVAVAGAEVGCFVADDLFYVHAALPSGSAFQTLTRLLGVDADAPLDTLLAGEPIGSRGVRVRLGRDRRIALAGIAPGTSAATVLRALAEETAAASARLADQLGAVAGGAPARRLIAGAPVASATWRQVRRATSAVPTEFVEAAETTALGAAHLAVRAVTGAFPPPAPRRPADPPLDPAAQREHDALVERLAHEPP